MTLGPFPPGRKHPALEHFTNLQLENSRVHSMWLEELETMSHSTNQALLGNKEVKGLSFIHPTPGPSITGALNLVEKLAGIKCIQKAKKKKIS